MEVILLQDFISLAETGVFARAAEKRNVTQPAFTRRIKKLEHAVGANLIDRSIHPVSLTEAGTKFLTTAQNIVHEWERSRAELADESQKDPRVKIAVLQSLAVAYLPHLVKSLYPHNQLPHFQIIADNFASCIEAMILGSADAMICYSHKDISTGDHQISEESHDLGSDKLIPVSCIENGRPKFTLEDPTIPYLKYCSTSFLGRMTALLHERSSTALPLYPVYEDSIAAALKSAAIEGLGVAWLPENLIAPEIQTGILANLGTMNPELTESLGITIYRGSRDASRAFDSFWHRVLQ